MPRKYDRDNKEDCKILDVYWLRQYGYFCGFKSGGISWEHGRTRKQSSVSFIVETADRDSYSIRFMYSQSSLEGDQKDFDYKFGLETTSCYFGGNRYWFRCGLIVNGQTCNRRAGTLYLPPGAQYFGCRHCYDLTYKDRRVNRKYGYYHLFRTIKLSEKSREMVSNLRKKYHKGKPTKKHLSALKWQDKAYDSAYSANL